MAQLWPFFKKNPRTPPSSINTRKGSRRSGIPGAASTAVSLPAGNALCIAYHPFKFRGALIRAVDRRHATHEREQTVGGHLRRIRARDEPLGKRGGGPREPQ